jgi:hypothetical protein
MVWQQARTEPAYRDRAVMRVIAGKIEARFAANRAC